jgi:hypothetical protein
VIKKTFHNKPFQGRKLCFGKKPALPLPALFLLAALMALAAFSGCDLLNNKPEIDLEKALDDEIVWANAARLTVRMEYPADWGSSNPAQGTITPARDIRRGFPFDLEFNPGGIYSFFEWRAYAASTVPADWQDDPDARLGSVARLDTGGGVVISGETKVTVRIDTATPVVLIPWCRNMPRIIGAEPPSLYGGTVPRYLPTQTIRINFAAALNTATVKYGEDFITITDGSGSPLCGDGAAAQYFKLPEYNGSYRAIIISPGDGGEGTSLPPDDTLVTITLGTGIQSATSTNGLGEAVSFSYRTGSGQYSFNGLAAEYDEGANKITVTWTYAGIDAPLTQGRYSLNGGPIQSMRAEGPAMVIDNAPRLDASGVREGRAVSGVNSYSIYLEAVSEGLSEATSPTLKIWNVPGMSVSSANPAVEITDVAGFSGIPVSGTAGKTYVLANDITLAADWTPVGKDDDNDPNNGSSLAFTGTFYGNGHTITVSDNPVDTMYTGLFGYTEGAEIRDLSVYYAATTVNSATVSHTGGIAGYAGGATEIRNVITGGSLSLISSGGNAAYAGGIAGETGGGADIRNCLSGVNVTLNKGSTGGDMYAGGIAGKNAGTGILEDVVYSGVLVVDRINASASGAVYTGGIAGHASTSIHNASFAGTITILPTFTSGTGSNYFGGLVGHYNTTGGTGSVTMKNAFSRGDLTVYRNSLCDLLVGGLAGNIIGTSANTISLENCAVESGDIRVVSGKNRTLWAGGCIGEIKQYVFFENVRSLGGSVTVEQTDTVNTGQSSYIGGFAGYLEGSTVNGSFSNTTVTGNFNSPNTSFAGGFIGNLNVAASAEIKNCYATGNVTVSNRSGALYAGGLLGRAAGSELSSVRVEQCYAAGELRITGEGEIWAGGLIGLSWAGLKIADCYALGNVLADMASTGPNVNIAGGLVGYTNYAGDLIERCFAGGAVIVRSASSGETIRAGGIAGYIDRSTITNNAAFGPSVTVKGASPLPLGRIGGAVTSWATLTNNYALADMRLETSNDYNDPNPTSALASGGAANNKDGADAAASAFKTASFWTGTLGFSASIWNMDGVGRRGYPTLAGMGGQ